MWLLPLGEGWDGASVGRYAPPATLTELLLLVAILNTASISVLLKAVSLRAGIGSLMGMMTQKIVEEKCIEIKIVLKCRENDNEL